MRSVLPPRMRGAGRCRAAPPGDVVNVTVSAAGGYAPDCASVTVHGHGPRAEPWTETWTGTSDSDFDPSWPWGRRRPPGQFRQGRRRERRDRRRQRRFSGQRSPIMVDHSGPDPGPGQHPGQGKDQLQREVGVVPVGRPVRVVRRGRGEEDPGQAAPLRGQFRRRHRGVGTPAGPGAAASSPRRPTRGT